MKVIGPSPVGGHHLLGTAPVTTGDADGARAATATGAYMESERGMARTMDPNTGDVKCCHGPI